MAKCRDRMRLHGEASNEFHHRGETVKEYYNFKNILALLTEGFSPSELKTMCFVEPALRSIYENWPDNANKVDLVRSIVESAHQKLAIEDILRWAKENNSSRYEKHQPYLADEITKDNPLVQLVPQNDLGHRIILGGNYQGTPLEIAATNWAKYGNTLVRSGWLFIPQLTESHAVAFFKIHISADGQGYIHLVDVANPPHNIWLTTQAGFRQEKVFHHRIYPVDLWQFTWKSEEIVSSNSTSILGAVH
jgi:hypothetical protein